MKTGVSCFGVLVMLCGLLYLAPVHATTDPFGDLTLPTAAPGGSTGGTSATTDSFAGLNQPGTTPGTGAGTANTNTAPPQAAGLTTPPTAPTVAATGNTTNTTRTSATRTPTNTGGSGTTLQQPVQTSATQSPTYSGSDVQPTYGTYPEAAAQETNTNPEVQNPQNTASANSSSLYLLIAIIAGVVILIGGTAALVLTRHKTPESLTVSPPTAPIPPPQGITAPNTTSAFTSATAFAPNTAGYSSATIVHHPSVQEARQYVMRCRTLGYSDQQIRDQFIRYSWTDEQAALAMRRE